MGFKTGAVVGFAVGYYLGSKAGRERYEQINTWIDRAAGLRCPASFPPPSGLGGSSRTPRT